MKYFCVSDIHGYFDQLIDALNKAGFDRENPEHTLVSCGDHFDRGPQPEEVMDYLMSLPRKVLLRGNHEDLLVNCCKRGFAFNSDRLNGTVATIDDLATEFIKRFPNNDYNPTNTKYQFALQIAEPFLTELRDYYETECHVFVHAWIPVLESSDVPIRRKQDIHVFGHPDWRNASKEDWDRARWLNPFMMAKRRLYADKTIVCGHWHCSLGWANSEGRSEFGNDACFDIYDGEHFIAIDACTAYTGTVNVLVIEDSPIEDITDNIVTKVNRTQILP